METSILHRIKKRAGLLIEPQLLKPGTVLEVRAWQPATIIEIDLHLPFADMSRWMEIPYIKFWVDDLTYRDYTPMGWDAATQTCTIIVDTAHTGPGSSWAKNLRNNDIVRYLKIDTSHQAPDPTSLVVGLGDESSMAHLLALQQKTLPVSRFEGALLMKSSEHHNLFKQYFKSPLQPLLSKNGSNEQSLIDWVMSQGYCFQHTTFYIAGNNSLVSRLRKMLKQQGYIGNRIKVIGFWS